VNRKGCAEDMSDTTIQSRYFPTNDRIELNQAGLTRRAQPKE